MFRLKEMPRVRALDYIHSPPVAFKSAQPTQTDMLAVRAAIFRIINGKSHLLLLQRSGNDSLPGCWELPGGGVEDDDESIKTALYREIKEETGMTAAWIVQEIGEGERWEKTKDGKKYHFMCVTFIVEAEEVELLERGLDKEVKGEGTRSDPTNGGGTSSDGLVKLSDAEHQDFVWITEEELRNGKTDRVGELKFTRNMEKVMLEAFELQQVIVMAKSSE
ncbi:NUDIX hydrolase domain-like protein [Elsinoe ampelina]|uniref:NUDIX hydrolase domain-like protein n=1 Tax=Elsinoe ampelina TaxID=302913 RepID=A0A6A6G1L4_9PEZI|nr:NUDIX hydrolase domain-like protein [Elsinoe ampelina]